MLYRYLDADYFTIPTSYLLLPLDRLPAFLTSDDFIRSNELVRRNDRSIK